MLVLFVIYYLIATFVSVVSYKGLMGWFCSTENKKNNTELDFRELYSCITAF